MAPLHRSTLVVLLSAATVTVLGGCSTRSGWEYAGEEIPERSPSNIMTLEQIAAYPSNWSIEEVMVQGIPGLVLTSSSSGSTAIRGGESSYAISDGPSQHISVRGIGGGPALIIVDGVPRQEGESQIGLSPQDVSRIEVLRDAASTAMYGFRGAQGVILITTKRGDQEAN
jgi:TonB-dependent SusC/RagA subfamily outer membrane receptor